MQLIGGPLDGAEIEEKVSLDEPFIILEAKGSEKKLYCCYKLTDDKLIFVSSKTKEQLLNYV